MNINRLSDEDIQKKITELLAEWPVLKSITPDNYCDCCVSCTKVDIAYDYSWPVADAWEELQDLYYLLSE